MSNATRQNLTLTNNAYTFLAFRFGNFATVTNRAKGLRQVMSNEAAGVLADELLASGWVAA